MQVFDWEIGQLYWSCLKRTNNDEAVALARLKKIFWRIMKKDVHFFLGRLRCFTDGGESVGHYRRVTHTV